MTILSAKNALVAKSRQCRANCSSSWDFSKHTLVHNIVPLDDENSYRTADSISLVSVPSSSKPDSSQLMVEKRSIYRQTRKGAVDAFKHGSSHNEWNVWSRHQAKIDTSNLVRLFGLTDQQDDDSPNGSSSIRLYSEHCAGGDLDTSMLHSKDGKTNCRLTEAKVKEITLDVLVGLNALHQQGLIHGDIKPSNIFINHRAQERDSYLIGDYGSLREVGTENLSYFTSGFGSTIEYASPEVLEHGSGKAKQSSDVYALGVMMQEMILGRLPQSSLDVKQIYDEEEGSINGGGRQAAIDKYRKGNKSSTSINEEMRQFIDPETGNGLSEGLIQAIESCSNASEAVRPANASEVMKLSWFSRGLESSGRGHLLGGIKATKAYEKWLKDWEPETIDDLEWE